MVILAPDGKSLADRVVQPMTHEQVSWFMEPVAFLNNVPHLWTLTLRVFCLRCWKHGLKDDVRVEWRDTDGSWSVRCACSKVAGRLPREAIATYATSTDELLRKLGWSFSCTGRCAKEAGMADGVEASNDPQAHTLSVRCGCTDRRYVMAHA